MKILLIIIAAFVCAVSTAQSVDVFGNIVPDRRHEKTFDLPDMPNKTDEQGRKQGLWAKKYGNGQYRYIATFVDGLPVDTTTRFDERGKKTVVMVYHAADDTVDAQYFHENGKTAMTGQYVAQKREGMWRYFNERGVLVASEHYRAGARDGVAAVYYEEGNVAQTLNYVGDVEDGPWRQYLRNGRVRLEATYVAGKLEGRYRYWDDGGSISVEGQYKNDRNVGDWKIYEGTTFYYMKYDDYGNLLNEDEINERTQRKLEMMEQNRWKLKDPQEYLGDPEGYFLN